MINRIHLRNILIAMISAFVLYSCANRGQGPQGGPKDEVPPRVLRSTPADKSVNVSRTSVEIEFDENVNLKEITKNVIISPPQRTNPEIRAIGKKVSVNFNDTLIDNTTYSIDFGNAIVDNNEGNILKNYVFSFATGDQIDTLQISGTLINAEDLNPLTGVIVGIHSDLSDTTLTTRAFERVTRSSDDGKFTVHNVKEKQYRVYALNDLNRDNFYQAGEGAAFNETVFQTSTERYIRQDTIWKDSLTVDTIRSVEATRFLPNNVILKFFKDKTKRQYLAKTERTERHKLTLFFNTFNEKLPEITALNVDWNDKFLLQRSETLDTLHYWLTDSMLIKKDTISLQVKYLKTDSVMKLQPQTDTVNFIVRKPTRAQAAAATPTAKKKEFFEIGTNLTSSFEVYNPVKLTFNTPVRSYDLSKVHLSQLVDTVLTPIQFELQKTDSAGMNFTIHHKWIPETTYQLVVDSAAFFSIYDLHNDNLKNELRIKSLDDYSSLDLTLVKFDPTAVFQVVSKEDVVVRTTPINRNGVTQIEHLQPGDYYVRMFLDRNGNGKWDTGSVLEKLQPEEVFYYSKKLTLIKNWKFEESWDHTSTPLLEQKPAELKKTTEVKSEN